MMRPVYIAGPYAGDVERNVRRACALSRLALACGLAPVCVHPGIVAGAYGDDADPAERAMGLATSARLVEVVRDAGGLLWVLMRDDGTASPGTSMEIDRYASRPRVPWQYGTWAQWRDDFARHGLLGLWDEAT